MAYGVLALTLIASLTGVVWKIRREGAQAERVKALNKSLTRMQQEARERAKLEAITTAAARKQLRDRWSAR